GSVRLRVTDDDGASNTTSVPINVTARAGTEDGSSDNNTSDGQNGNQSDGSDSDSDGSFPVLIPLVVIGLVLLAG
ncbi:MAG: hypothetical protein SXQ77_08000, partial [Halobacteria archaeon]|nr:hypothetical protein [Halobacteria archaeon]